MQEPQILSTPQTAATLLTESTGRTGARAGSSSPSAAGVEVFDTCHVGVVMRAVLFVEAALGVVALFGAAHWSDWIAKVAVLTGAAFPATLGWLLLACACRRWLSRRVDAAQVVLGVIGGAAFGLLASWLLVAIGFAAPLWSTLAGGAAAGALAAASVVAWLFWRARARQPAAERAALSDLQARIRPHFLFNTLNSAIALVRSEPARAERLLEDLSDLFRAALDDPRDLVPLADEVELAQRYLAIEQARFGCRLRVRWAVAPVALQQPLPRLLLQPLLENAVRYGVEPSEQGADIEVTAEVRDARVVIDVVNTLPVTGGSAGHGLGLSSVRERLRLLHDVQARVDAAVHQGADGARFRVRLDLPAVTNPRGAA